MRYLVLHEIKDRQLIKKEYHINKCGDCPERTMGDYCIRKHVFVNLGELYERCPLKGDGD